MYGHRKYGPDGSILPAMNRLQRQDKLCWVVIKFLPAPAEMSPDGVAWSSPGKCFTTESFGDKRDGGIADWSRFLASMPAEECRLGIFRFDFRAVRKFVLVCWSPPSTKLVEWEDTQIWDIRKQALKEGIDPVRVEEAEGSDTPRESLVALLLELTLPEKLRGICVQGLATLAEFLGRQPKVKLAESRIMRLTTDSADCVQEARVMLEDEAAAAAAEVARADAHLAARKARQLAEAYATAFYYRRTKYEGEVRDREAAAAAKREKEERESNEESERRRIADEARKRAEYGAKAERDPVWRDRLAAAKKGQRDELTRWYHEHSLVAPSDPDIMHKGVRRARVGQASSLVRGEVSSDLREAALKPYQKLLAKASAARSAVYDPPSTAPDWSGHREVKFTEPGSLGLRLEEDQYGIVTVGALLSEERWEHATETMQYDDGVAKATGQIRVGDRVVKVAAGEPGVTPESQLIEFAGYKVRLTVILGVLARNIRPITFTFGPPVFGGYPKEEEGGPRPVTPVEWGAPPAQLHERPDDGYAEYHHNKMADAAAGAGGPLGPGVSQELSAIPGSGHERGGSASPGSSSMGEYDTADAEYEGENTVAADGSSSSGGGGAIPKGAPTIGVGSSLRPAIGIRIPMTRLN
jgi:hypothetical protein